MADDSLAVVIEGRRDDWPGGARLLMPCPPSREPNGRTYWFGAELDPDGRQLWFRITSEAIHRMREKTPRARGACFVDALITWMTPERQLGPELNRFQVHVLGEDGYLWIERYGD